MKDLEKESLYLYKPERVICILGMHRSGTSCLMGSLQKAGLYLGKVSTWDLHNKQGNREHPDIFELHEDLLASNGGSWNNPPERVIWSEHHLDWGRRIIAGFSRSGNWGFKDPRTLLTLDGWKSLLDNIVQVIFLQYLHDPFCGTAVSVRIDDPPKPGFKRRAIYLFYGPKNIGGPGLAIYYACGPNPSLLPVADINCPYLKAGSFDKAAGRITYQGVNELHSR